MVKADLLAKLLAKQKLEEIAVDQDVLIEENERAAGLGESMRKGVGWWRAFIGKQIIQLAPYAFIDAAGELKFDWCVVYHCHRGKMGNPFIWDNASKLVRELRKTLPGWQLMCPQETYGQACVVCEKKWEIGQWFVDNTTEGWKHKGLQGVGLFPEPRAMSHVMIRQHAGDWLRTKEGKAWIKVEKRKLKRANDPDKCLKRFKDGIEEAKDHAELWSDHVAENGDQPIMGAFGRDLYKELASVAGDSEYGVGQIISPTAGLQLTIEITINPDNSYRDTRVKVHPKRSPLVADKKGKPNKKAIRELISSLANLRLYRDYPSEEVVDAVHERLKQLESELCDKDEDDNRKERRKAKSKAAKGEEYISKDEDEFDDDDELDDDGEDFEESDDIEVDVDEEEDDLEDDEDDDEEAEEEIDFGMMGDEEEEDDELDDDEIVERVKKASEKVREEKKKKKKGGVQPTDEEDDGGKPICFQMDVWDEDNDYCSVCIHEPECAD